MTTTMQAAQISIPGGDWELVERVIPEPHAGQVRVILATAPSALAISALIDGLSPGGTLLVPAAPAEPLTVSVLSLISGRRSVAGWYAGTARDSQDTLEFSWLSAVHR
jgi:D-arabinose 1-dehydrogenase-like Zn-dependent alcohol dehydrogenase